MYYMYYMCGACTNATCTCTYIFHLHVCTEVVCMYTVWGRAVEVKERGVGRERDAREIEERVKYRVLLIG